MGDFFGEALLYLQPPSEYLGNARELREPDDGIGGDIADVYLRPGVSFSFKQKRGYSLEQFVADIRFQ